MPEMRKLALVLLIGLLSLSILPVTQIRADSRKALILSSLQKLVPIRNEDLTMITKPLTAAGYIITYLTDDQITVKFLTTSLNNFDVIIWRTNTYVDGHTTYWYLGEAASATTLRDYSSDFASKWLDNSHGIIGVNPAYFQNHLGARSLWRVKLAILASSLSSSIAGFILNAGVRSVVAYSSTSSLQFSVVDNLTGTLIRYLSQGYNVGDAVANTIAPYLMMQPRDPLDSIQVPQMAFSGDSAVTIA